ncbi:Protein of unknown function [Robiginitalea myxolifaciens]|uniref:DUF2911 domain-containing protein n=1 Tax=Robiginitalea myxolifaciens TaxID=400055 RepID=A0A1I6HDA6_9FLAO|nr:DUF2911 domain-containing protein [Robiginitalea myxolifaciens]SFR52320.1 Protein of unknown function [Robiginitalea myxolifaciens]
MKVFFGFTFMILLGTVSLKAQHKFPSLSPLGTVTQQVGNTKFSISYERPAVRGRKIFGGLVPWDEVWRTGAGENTTIAFDRDVRINGSQVPAGKYSLFTIPNPDRWTVILNRDTTLYGAYDYDSQKDMIRFEVVPQTTQRYYESMSLDVDVTSNNGIVAISWENTLVAFPVETSTNPEMMAYIDTQLLTGIETIPDQYNDAADHLRMMDLRWDDAYTLTTMALERNGNRGYSRSIQIGLYEDKGMLDKALEIAKIALEEEERQEEKQYWRNDIARLEQLISQQ